MRFQLIRIVFVVLVLSLNLSAIVYAEPEPAKDSDVFANPSFEQFFESYQTYLKNVKPYEPIYFLMGTNPEKSKFQFSFRYQLFNEDAPVLENYEWLDGLNFAFTQTSYWDLKSASQPFEDSSYKPELFFLSPNLREGEGVFKGFFWQAGVQHESNGQAGEISRATNTVYLKPMIILYDEEMKRGLQLAPKFMAYVENDDDTNPDIADYRGYCDIELKIGKQDSGIIQTNFRPAKEGNSVSVDFTYPVNKYFSNNIGVFLHLQYVNSLGENLRNYQQRTEAVRVGVSLIR